MGDLGDSKVRKEEAFRGLSSTPQCSGMNEFTPPGLLLGLVLDSCDAYLPLLPVSISFHELTVLLST